MHVEQNKLNLNISIDNGVGIIGLNRPKAINALTPQMMMSIHGILQEWSKNTEIRFVLIEGKGEKGFCAGGDVRWTREIVLRGDEKEAFEFFKLEYEMNHMIATYDKPIVALTHGVVMGGGLGLAGHAKYRITTENSRFAMPEAAIGYFCDVGVRSILAKGARHRALMFMLAGSLVGAVDAVVLGLSDTMILESGFASMRASLIKAGSASDVDAQILGLCAAFGISYGFASFCNLADKFAKLFDSIDATEIYAKLELEVAKKSELAEIAQIILSRCPTSNWVHVLGLDAARQRPNVFEVLAADLRLAHLLAVREDFIEGVRAVLVDKDHAPIWAPAQIDQVDVDAIRKALM